MKRTLLAAAACIWAASAHAQSDTQTGQTSDNGPNVSPAAAQTDSINGRLATLKGEVDGLNESYLATKATVDKLAKVKISGYIQTQFRAATQYDDATDTTGTGAVSKKSSDRGTYRYPVGDFAGGKFDTRVPNLFQIRRGRVKVAYETELTTGVLQLDVIPFANINLAEPVTTVLDSVWEDSAHVWVQNLWKYDQFVLKYDKFDPNTEVEGDKITSATELAYGTLGLGLIHNWDENIKLMAYYEIPRNETSKHLPTKDTFYRKDLADNVFTFRIQYKF